MRKILARASVFAAVLMIGLFLFMPSSQASDSNWNVKQTVLGTFVIRAVNPLDQPVLLNASSYTVPETWDGNGFDASASPQVEFAHTTVLYPAHSTEAVTVSVDLPKCGVVQDDLYTGEEQKTVTYPTGTINGIKGHIWRIPCSTPTPTPSVTPTPTPTIPSTTPTASHSSPGSGPKTSHPTTPTGPELPKTGPSQIPLEVGLGLLGLGTLLTLAAHRKGTH